MTRDSSINRNYLILVVGTNPLPVFAGLEQISQIMIDDDNTTMDVIFLCSSDSLEQAQTNQGREGSYRYVKPIRCLFKEYYPMLKYNFNIVEVEDPYSSFNVRTSLFTRMNDMICNDNNQIHINYSGGTKPMIKETLNYFSQNYDQTKLIYSYIDGSKNRLIIEHPNSEDIIDLKQPNTKITNHGVLRLHGINTIGSGIDNLDGDRYKIQSREFADYFESELDFSNKAGKFKEKLTEFNFVHKNDNKGILGQLFERYVFLLIEKICSNIDPEIECLFDNREKRKGAKQPFQIDIIIRVKYKLIGISVTVSTERVIVKNKGFEVIHRVKQLGGDLSHAVVITLLSQSKIDDLLSDLKTDIFQFNFVDIFGFSHFKDDHLTTAIQGIINNYR